MTCHYETEIESSVSYSKGNKSMTISCKYVICILEVNDVDVVVVVVVDTETGRTSRWNLVILQYSPFNLESSELVWTVTNDD
jgi:hypothetical protein